MTLIRRIWIALNLLEQQQRLISAQQQLIEDQNQRLQRLHLEHLREMRGLVAGWLIHHEQPEVDLREDLAALDRTLDHQAAVLEEHVV